MNQQQRLKLIESQLRSYDTGTVEHINEQWIFFDEETEEAALLEQFSNQEIEILRKNSWKRGDLLDGGSVKCGKEVFQLEDGEMIRVRKQLVYSLERLLAELKDEAFLYFINTLNSLHFSIHDCIYCYNHLTFLDPGQGAAGVNFLIFDNEESICSIQHHFNYGDMQNDRFEFTLSSGKRTVIEKIS